jgi:hypothetical protein
MRKGAGQQDGWLFPAPTKSGHMEESGIEKQAHPPRPKQGCSVSRSGRGGRGIPRPLFAKPGYLSRPARSQILFDDTAQVRSVRP